jgi:hypothetical protein
MNFRIVTQSFVTKTRIVTSETREMTSHATIAAIDMSVGCEKVISECDSPELIVHRKDFRYRDAPGMN